jgi:hypothetical protein
MDALWTDAVAEDLRVPMPTPLPFGLDMRPKRAVKLMGSFKDPLMVLSSYPTADPDSTVHLDFSTVNDMLKSSLGRPLVKLSFHIANFRVTRVC